jgi:hypothetical protein
LTLDEAVSAMRKQSIAVGCTAGGSHSGSMLIFWTRLPKRGADPRCLAFFLVNIDNLRVPLAHCYQEPTAVHALLNPTIRAAAWEVQ